MSANPSSSPALRASDADRDRVIELLHAAAADGRFDPAESARGCTSSAPATAANRNHPRGAEHGPGQSEPPHAWQLTVPAPRRRDRDPTGII